MRGDASARLSGAAARTPTPEDQFSDARLSHARPGIPGREKPSARQRGVSALKALLVLIGFTAVGCLFDVVRGQQLAGGFNVCSIIGSIAAILVVRRRSMFPIVVAPPIVYAVGAGVFLYLRSGALSNHGVLIDAAANWLVYGFPAVSAATAAVLIIAGVRLIARR